MKQVRHSIRLTATRSTRANCWSDTLRLGFVILNSRFPEAVFEVLCPISVRMNDLWNTRRWLLPTHLEQHILENFHGTS